MPLDCCDPDMSIWPTVSPFELLVYFTILVSVGHGRASWMAQPLFLSLVKHIKYAWLVIRAWEVLSIVDSAAQLLQERLLESVLRSNSRSSLRRALPHILGLLYGVLMDPNYQNFHDSTYCLSIWQVREFRRFVVGEEVP